MYLYDAGGKCYLDGCGGAAVSCLGHSNAAVINALKQQIDKLTYAHTSFFTSAPAEELADKLAAAAPGNLNHVYIVCGGSEATEAAIKLARQYHCERGEKQRRYIIGRWQSYHGNTLGALSVGGNRQRRRIYEPLLFDNAQHIDPCHYWRWGDAGETEAEYGQRMAQQLEDKILQLGADAVAAFIVEPVVGATMGAVTAVPGYFQRIRDICSQYGVLLIFDEVMCGMGRTGALFTCEQEHVVPDIVCIAKGIGGGIQPLGAMLVNNVVYETVTNNSQAFQHGHTYLGHPMACAAGVAVQNEIQRLLGRVNIQGVALMQRLHQRLGEHPHVGDIRGRGLFLGVEFVADRATKAPLPPEKKTYAAIRNAAFQRGLMVYSGGGTVDGTSGDHILIAPPFIVEDKHLDELTDKFTAAINEVLG